jgi:hypothetical protein
MNRQSPTEEVLINQDDLMTQDGCEQSFIDLVEILFLYIKYIPNF